MAGFINAIFLLWDGKCIRYQGNQLGLMGTQEHPDELIQAIFTWKFRGQSLMKAAELFTQDLIEHSPPLGTTTARTEIPASVIEAVNKLPQKETRWHVEQRQFHSLSHAEGHDSCMVVLSDADNILYTDFSDQLNSDAQLLRMLADQMREKEYRPEQISCIVSDSFPSLIRDAFSGISVKPNAEPPLVAAEFISEQRRNYAIKTGGLTQAARVNTCAYCGHKGKKRELSRCSGCHSVAYCDKYCQKADWLAGHKERCAKGKK